MTVLPFGWRGVRAIPATEPVPLLFSTTPRREANVRCRLPQCAPRVIRQRSLPWPDRDRRNDLRNEPASHCCRPDGAAHASRASRRFVRPYRRQVGLRAIALVVAAAAVLTVGQGLKGVIDRGFAAGNAARARSHAGADAGRHRGDGGARRITRFYFVSWLGERVTADLRRAVFDHLLALPPAFFEVTRTGEVISRLTNDTTMLETVIGSSASMAVRNAAAADRRPGDAGAHQRSS